MKRRRSCVDEMREWLGLNEPDHCPCPCHFTPDHCAICSNDWADLCTAEETRHPDLDPGLLRHVAL